MAEGEIFVGNLPHDAKKEEIKSHFSSIGQVHSINLVTDHKGRSRCFGFIVIDNPDEAIEQLNEKEFHDRKLRVSRSFRNDSPPWQQGFHRRRR